LLSLEKKQLEVVIGNSMKKIEDLLNSQAEYKKIIRELERKIENKNYNDEY
jgi:ATP-dependent Lon protease